MITLLLGSAQTWECDQMGHWNVRFYLERFREAALCWQDRVVGWSATPRPLGADHIRFLREVLPGTPYAVRGGLVEPGTDDVGMTARRSGTVQLYLELVRTVDREVCATCLSESFALADLSSEQVAAHLVEVPTWGRPLGIRVGPPGRADAHRAEELGLIPIHHRVVAATDCDEHSVARPGLLMGCVSDGIPHLVWQLRGQDRGNSGSRGGAALEYRFLYRRLPRAGERIVVRSGLAGLGSKTMRFVHWILDPVTGAAWATAEAVAVSFDLERRRAVAFTESERTQLEQRIVDGLQP